jgi:hypothetical protein
MSPISTTTHRRSLRRRPRRSGKGSGENELLASGAPGGRSGQRRRPTDSSASRSRDGVFNNLKIKFE